MMWIPADQFQVGSEYNSDVMEPTHCVVSGALANILRISRVFGLAPLRFVSHDNGYTITVSKPMRIYSYILNAVLVICSLLNVIIQIIETKDPFAHEFSKTQQILYLCKNLMKYIITSVGICGAPKRMQNIFRVVKTVALVDKNVGWQQSVKLERKIYAFACVMIFVFVTIVVSDFCLWISVIRKFDLLFWMLFNNYISLFVMGSVMIILELQFAVIALLVQARLGAVNTALVVITDNVLDDFHVATSPHKSIRRLAISYGTLCDTVQLVNDSYGWPLVTLVVAILVDIVVTLYFLIFNVIMSTTRVKFYVIQCIWCVYHFMRMLNIVEPCHNTVKEGKSTKRLVCHLITKAPSTGLMAARLQLFSKQLTMWSVSYAPLSMFTLDRTLLTAAIGAITTYLVILIQFNISV